MKTTIRTFPFPDESLDYRKAEATIRSVIEVCEFAARQERPDDEIHYDRGEVSVHGFLRIPRDGTLEMVVNSRDGQGSQKMILHYGQDGEYFANEQSNGARWEVLRESRSGTLFYTEQLPD